jgi:hypothetical protein
MNCIFCGNRNHDKDDEHIIPASFGGKNSPKLANGMVCKRCNNYFSHEFENTAIHDFPINIFSIFWGITNRHGKQRKIETNIGTISYGGKIGYINMHTTEPMVITSDGTVELEYNPNPFDPVSVCRLFCKIAYEYLWLMYPNIAGNSIYNSIRDLVRFPKIGANWSFAIHGKEIFLQNIARREMLRPFELELIGNSELLTIFTIKIMDMTILIPLIKEKVDIAKNETIENCVYNICIQRKG